MKVAAAFDSLAARYDELWTESAAGRSQRELVWRRLDPFFRPGMRLLDLGCGTGTDAAHYAGRDLLVDAVDASAEMIARARAHGGFEARVLCLEDVRQLEGPYDCVLSNFGALNCQKIGGLSTEMARLIPRGGTLAICVLGRFCAWETIYYTARGRWRRAFRRITGSASSSLGITVQYPTVRQLAKAFAPQFALRYWTGIGLAVPPSYVRVPRGLVKACGHVDRVFAGVPVLRATADHRLLVFERI